MFIIYTGWNKNLTKQNVNDNNHKLYYEHLIGIKL